MTNWLDYLLAAYPTAAAKMTEGTPAVYETQFADVDPARMMRVAVEAVKRSKWFPAVQELAAIAAELAEAADIAAAGIWRAAAVRELGRQERAAWPVCPACGEHSPNLTNCPFCADMVAIAAELEVHP